MSPSAPPCLLLPPSTPAATSVYECAFVGGAFRWSAWARCSNPYVSTCLSTRRLGAQDKPPSAKMHGKLPVQPHSAATDPAPPTSAPLPAEQPPATKATPVSASAARASRPIVAADLLAKSAEREAATRPPCPPDGADMASFEACFLHEPSADQRRAFAGRAIGREDGVAMRSCRWPALSYGGARVRRRAD